MVRSSINRLNEIVRNMKAVHAAGVIVVSSFALGAGVNVAGHFLHLPRPIDANAATVVPVPPDSVRDAFYHITQLELQFGRLRANSDSAIAILTWQQCVVKAQLDHTDPYGCGRKVNQ